MQNRNFEDALFCFRKGDNSKGQKEAQAELYAEEAKSCKSSGHSELSITALHNAKDLFIELNLISKAATLLDVMDQLDEAARKHPLLACCFVTNHG